MTTPNEELLASLTQTNQFHESADICTADVIAVLQSQAERIAELERESETHSKAYGLAIVERDNLRHELKVAQEGWRCECSTDDACRFARERDALRAQLVAIAATEPVAWLYTAHDGSVQAFTNEPPHRLKELCKPVFNRAIPPVQREPMSDGALINAVANSIAKATRPMPVQDVRDAERYQWLREYMISSATVYDDLIVAADSSASFDRVIDTALANAKGAK